MNSHPKDKPFAVCVRNDGHEVDLEVGKPYRVLADEQAVRHGRIRVIDESGEDYLYPQDFFSPTELS